MSGAIERAQAAPARAVLEEIEAEGRLHLGPVSSAHGFLLPEPPSLALPTSHRAWDEAAAALPGLWRDLAARRVLGSELPLLSAAPAVLPDDMLWRAAVVLGALAYSYVRCDLDDLHAPAPIELPAQIAEPWGEVCERLGRPGLLLAYDDFVTHNYRLLDPLAADPVRLENLQLLVPLLGNDNERGFLGVNLEMQARLTPVVESAVRAQEAVVSGARDRLIEALLMILRSVRDTTEVAFMKIDPNPHADAYMDPAIWAKVTAPTGVPIVGEGPGMGGLGSTGFQLVDEFLGRTRFATSLGQEARKNRAWMAPNCRRFLDAVGQLSVRRHVAASGDRELAGLFQSLLDAYAGDRGYLGVHRRKIYGYIQTAFKVGRSVSASGVVGGLRDRTWRTVDAHLAEAREERYLEMFSHPQLATVAARDPATGASPVQQLTLDVNDTGLVFRPGDRLAILPEHTHELVDRTLQALHGRADHPVPLTSRWRTALHERFGFPPRGSLALGELLRFARLRPLSREVADLLQALSGSESLRAVLEAREEDRFELCDALEMAARAGYDVTRLWRAELWQDEALTRVVPPESERTYSVSNAPSADPFATEIVLTVGRLQFESPGPDNVDVVRHGAGSTYLARAAATGARVHVRVVRPLRFALPADPHRPVVMFAGGTGIAPFRGFVHARLAPPQGGPTWLFAAATSPDTLPYLDELQELADAGRIELRTAFSRKSDGDPPQRVDAVMADPANAAVLRRLLGEGDGVFYVCGTASFAAGVLDALATLAAPNRADGAGAIRRLAGSGRLMTDLFTTFAPRASAGVAGSGVYDASDLVLHNDDQHGWWTAIDGIVYDMTEFRQLHPGGRRIIDDNAGLDATSEYRAVLHHEDSEIEAMLAMYQIGLLRRLSFGRAWGVALSHGRIQYTPLIDAFRTWLRHLYLVVEHQNALRNDAAVLWAALTSGEEPGDRTALKLMLVADLQGRMLDVYLPGVAGEALHELWELACGLLDPLADATELPRALAAASAARRAGAATALFGDAVRAGVLDPVVAWPLVEELLAADAQLLAAVKHALREGLIVFETHQANTAAHGAQVLACLREIPPSVTAFYEQVAAVIERGRLHPRRR